MTYKERILALLSQSNRLGLPIPQEVLNYIDMKTPMIVTKQHDGSLLITDIVNNQLVKQKYMGYTRAEAKKLFKQHLKSLKN